MKVLAKPPKSPAGGPAGSRTANYAAVANHCAVADQAEPSTLLKAASLNFDRDHDLTTSAYILEI